MRWGEEIKMTLGFLIPIALAFGYWQFYFLLRKSNHVDGTKILVTRRSSEKIRDMQQAPESGSF